MAALGLAGGKVDELYRGSADFVKYRSIEAPTLGDLKLPWNDDNSPEYYIEKSPTAMVKLLREWEAISAEVARLTTQAKKELATAKRIFAAA